MLTSALSAYGSASTLLGKNVPVAGEDKFSAQPAVTPKTDNDSVGTTDTVSVSSTAKALSEISQRQTSYYEQFYPTRDGYTSAAIAAAISNPSAETFSAGKSLSEVADAVRTSFDQTYKEMTASGEPFNANSTEGKDWYSLMGNLDRRALYAVSSNQGGQFSKSEQDIAQSIMSSQQGWAMGLPSGPTRLVDGMSDLFGNNHATQFKVGIQWMDQVSDDEKSSLAWATQRAGMQKSYKIITGGQGENLDSDNPLVEFIKKLMAETEEGKFSVGNWDKVNLAAALSLSEHK